MKTRVTNERIWTQTSGLSASWQLLASSDMSCVRPPDVDTAPATGWFSQIIVPFELNMAVSAEDVARIELSPSERELQLGLVNLLGFAIRPDEPSDEDLRKGPGYPFPD